MPVSGSSPAQNTKGPFSGELTREEEISRIIRVDHAGEYGAVRIYQGQLAVMGDRHPLSGKLKHMQKQEEEHLDAFNRLIADRRVRPTVLTPLWDLAGFTLGAATALMGDKAAMACTVAIEECIDGHYAEQSRRLEGDASETDLKAKVDQFRAEELEHRDTAVEHGARDMPGFGLMYNAIQAGSKLAIFISSRF